MFPCIKSIEEALNPWPTRPRDDKGVMCAMSAMSAMSAFRRWLREGHRRMLLQKTLLYRFLVCAWIPMTLVGWFGLMFDQRGVMPWVQCGLWVTEMLAKALCVFIGVTGIAL